jgi:radical SAM superfamily enzyme YgiQ (UPF0313 family)
MIKDGEGPEKVIGIHDKSRQHLVLAAIDEEERPVSLRVLGAFSESLGVKTTILMIIKELASIGHPVVFQDKEIRQVAAFLKSEKVTHLGFYLMTGTLKPYARLVKALRNSGYAGVILAGGVHATLCPEEALVDGADYAVQGPGELPLKMILEGQAPESIPGLVWRRGDKIVRNAQTDAQKIDLDSLPFPLVRFDRDMILADGKLRRLTWRRHSRYCSWDGRYYDIATSRGCIFKCAYCCNVNGNKVRRASVDHVISELKNVRKREPRIKGVNIQDDSFFSGSDDWLKEFSVRMKAEVGLPFIVRMAPSVVTRERIELLKAAGLEYVTMGLEASSRLNKQVFQRHETPQTYLKAAKIVLEAGVYLSTDILINNPYETEADLREIAQTLNSLPRPGWGVVGLSLTPFPNTPLYERCVKDKKLGQFATDAYDSMLVASRPGGYITPRFWLLLNLKILPRVSQAVGEQLIAMGPQNPQAVMRVEMLGSYLKRTRAVTLAMQRYTPWLYAAVSVLLQGMFRRHKRTA